MSEKVVTSAIVVAPPEELWDPIQAIRSVHDKGASYCQYPLFNYLAFHRWMPHVNLIYPFVPAAQFVSQIAPLTTSLSFLAPFTLKFVEFGSFDHGRSNTIYLRPECDPPNALKELQAVLQDLYPSCDEQSSTSASGFTPHLTVGQCTGKSACERKMREWQKDWTPVEFTVSHVHLISRTDNDPFTVKFSIPLGNVALNRGANMPSLSSPVTGVEDAELRKAIVRVSAWLVNLLERNRRSLPKTKGALAASVKGLCTSTATVLSGQEVYDELLKESYFLAKQDGVQYPPVMPRNHYRTPNTPKEKVLARCREWLVNQGNRPKTPQTLVSSLAQLCLIKEVVDPHRVLDYLEETQRLCFNGDVVLYPDMH